MTSTVFLKQIVPEDINKYWSGIICNLYHILVPGSCKGVKSQGLPFNKVVGEFQ